MPINLNIFQTFIPKYIVDLKRGNDEVIVVSSSYLSPEGDAFYVDKRTIVPNLLQTSRSLQELNPEISNTYPFRIVCPLDFDGSTMIQSPSINTEPTASQSYYAPVYFERYDPDIIRNIDRTFSELTTAEIITEESQNEQSAEESENSDDANEDSSSSNSS